MDEKAQAIAAVFALSSALRVLCIELDKAGVMPRSVLAEAIQADYLRELNRGRDEDFLAAYRNIAVQIGPGPASQPS